MNKYLTGVLFALLIPLTVWGQAPEIKRERIFTGTGLYGFMNGGADQFLEYGVSKLTTRDIVYKGNEYTVDIYEMPTPEDAFGIYSLHVFKCSRADTLGCIDCLAPYQLQAVAGNKYISVVFPSGSAAAKSKVDELIRLYVPIEEKEPPRIPEALDLAFPYSGKLKLLRGPISVSGVSTSLANLLEGISYSGVWFIADKPVKGYRALIEVTDPKEIEILKKKVPAPDILKTGETYLFIKGIEKETEQDDHGGFGF
ncbi:DUF6599 family protein [uncultured Parabacteroides sp.]|uniref:DUF6599 family protein n=1 Tax=uncultured Parabacteroides sp. TaxID=512312 RepID=UPI0025F6D816|nr:DUF6599 family protein [uncultured Parabacteroides sp.]